MIGLTRRWNDFTISEVWALIRLFENPETRANAIEQCFEILDELGTVFDRFACLDRFALSIKPSDTSFDRVGKTLFAVVEAAAEQVRSETGRIENKNLLHRAVQTLGSHIRLMPVEQRTSSLFERVWPYADMLADADQSLDSLCRVFRAAIPTGPDFENARNKLGQYEEWEASRKEREAIRRVEENVRVAPLLAPLRAEEMQKHRYREDYVSAFLEQVGLVARRDRLGAANLCLDAILGYKQGDVEQLARIRVRLLEYFNGMTEPEQIVKFGLAAVNATRCGTPIHEAAVLRLRPHAAQIPENHRKRPYLNKRFGAGEN
jgi:hypothetical protein